MTSIADKIGKLIDPSIDLADPEDEVNIESLAKLSEKYDEDGVISEQISSLRALNAPRLDELDKRYAGRRISRKTFDTQGLEQGGSDESDDSMEEEDDENDEDNEDDDNLEMFKQSMSKHENIEPDSDLFDDESLGGDKDDMDEDNDQYEGGEVEKDDEEGDDDDEEGDDDDEDGDDDDEELDEDDDSDSGEDVIKKFSQINVDSEIERGKAVKMQQELWNKLCECRIKLQKLLLVSNRLPQPDSWDEVFDKSDKAYSESVKKSCKSVSNLLSGLLELQLQLLQSDGDYISSSKTPTTESKTDNIDDDEEIPSDSEVEDEDLVNTKKASSIDTSLNKEKLKRKRMNLDDYEEVLSKRHKSLIPYRNAVIQTWDEKTRLSTGRLTQKSFNAFDQSALKQIEQILQDKARLIKRTQLKRSVYNILGKVDVAKEEQNLSGEISEDLKGKYDPLKDYDTEIFDDDDFYRQLLKEIIETKSVGMDPHLLSKQLEIQKIRSKMKRKVDTKASKGRKIRYVVHSKLVNFMAPMMTCTIHEEGRDELFRSLFGSTCTNVT